MELRRKGEMRITSKICGMGAVIIGNELIFRDGLIQSHIPEEYHEMEKADKRVKMIYYVLFTRATENLHIYTVDEPLREYLKELCGSGSTVCGRSGMMREGNQKCQHKAR